MKGGETNMEIQAQTSIPLNSAYASNLNASVANGNPAPAADSTSLSGPSPADFSATLNGIMALVPVTATGITPTALSGLNMLVQILSELKSDIAVTEGQDNEDSLKQLDLLVKMLGDDSEEAEDILEDPEVQGSLAEIQAFLMMQTQAPLVSTSYEPQIIAATEQTTVETLPVVDNPTDNAQLNPFLFVPINSSSATVESTQLTSQGSKEPITKAAAFKLLDTFRELLKADEDKTVLPQADKAMQVMVDHLQKLIASVVEASTIVQASTGIKTDSLINAEVVAPYIAEKPSPRAFGIVPHIGSRTATSKGINADAPFQLVLTTANPKLEYLAANFVQTKLTVDNGVSDRPLFEPLEEPLMDSTDETPTIPMHEFLKQVQSAQPLMKPPVIIMQAPTFVEDMTQFVVKSFTLETKSEGFTEAKLSLYPQNLGQVDVKLTMHNGQLVAQFMADSSMGKEMLESQLPQLKTALQNQGIQVERLEVSQNQAFQSGMFQDQRQQQSQQSNKQQKGNNTDKILSLDEQINLEVSNTVNASNTSKKTTFDTTA